MDTIKKRLRERSTYVGLSVLFGLAGVTVAPEALELLGAAVLGVVGVVEAARDEDADE